MDGHDTVEGTLPDEEWRDHVHAALEDGQLALDRPPPPRIAAEGDRIIH